MTLGIVLYTNAMVIVIYMIVFYPTLEKIATANMSMEKMPTPKLDRKKLRVITYFPLTCLLLLFSPKLPVLQLHR